MPELDASDLAERAKQSRPAPTSKLKQRSHFWIRWAHVYTSMISLLLVLFFGITGLTLNHPDWTFGDEVVNRNIGGVLPADAITDGDVEFLVASEHVRVEHGVKGEVADFGQTETDGSITFKGPGYGAELFFEIPSGDYSLTIQEQGFIGVMNDLHKGRDSSTLWRWVIDISAGLLVLISLTGLGIQFFMRKRRLSALSWAIIGTIVGIILIWLAMA